MQAETKVIKLADRLFKFGYDPDRANSLAMDGPFGKCSKNLTIRMVDRELPVSRHSSICTYKYSFDCQKRVAKLVQTVKSTDPPANNNDAKLADAYSFIYY